MKRKKNLKILLIVLIGLIILTSCKSVSFEKEIIKEILSVYPKFPDYPKLNWEFTDNEMYSLNENDADLLLDFFENKLEKFKQEYELYLFKISEI